MYRIEIVPDAIEELRLVPAFYRQLVISAIETQLSHEPTRVTRNRKCLEGLVAGFEHEPPIWELRVQNWRVFYDVDDEVKMVIIRAVRQKPADKTTGEIV